MPDPVPESSSPRAVDHDAEETIRRFHELFYSRQAFLVEWLGVPTVKCPLDLWMYQQILWHLRPDVVIETGTGRGGTTYFLACICELIGAGRVVTVDAREVRRPPSHPRITYVRGSSTDPGVVDEVRANVAAHERVMVVLDSNHEEAHVAAELGVYAPLVSPGHYLIVEDTNINGHPVYAEHGPGPMEAVQAFLRTPIGGQFEVDRSCERFLLTLNPGGFLRRTDIEQPD